MSLSVRPCRTPLNGDGEASAFLHLFTCLNYPGFSLFQALFVWGACRNPPLLNRNDDELDEIHPHYLTFHFFANQPFKITV